MALIEGFYCTTFPLVPQVEYPEVFISYCWVNSKDAVDKGTAKKQKALGWGDPRKIKEFLQKNGVSCWLDTEQMGQVR